MVNSLFRITGVFALALGFLSAPACGEQESKKTTVVFSFGKVSQQHETVLREIMDRFEQANPSIRIVLHSLAPVTDLQRHFYHQSFTARSRFIDVFEMDTIWTGELAAAGVLAKPPGIPDDLRQRIEPQVLEGASYGGELYAVPSFPAVSVLYYRKDLLDKHGFEPPTTWSKLQEIALSVGGAEGLDGFVWQGDRYEGLVCNFLEYYWSHGGTLVTSDNNIKLDESMVQAALTTMSDFIDKKVTPGIVTEFREAESRKHFLSGKAVFLREWGDVTGFVADSNVAGKVGLAQLPGTALHRGVPTLGGWHLGVNKYSTNPEAAWALTQFITSPEIQKYLADRLGRFPVDVSIPIPHRDSVHDAGQIHAALALSRPRPASPYYNPFSVLIQNNVHDVLTGSLTVEKAAQAIVAKARKMQLPSSAGPDFPRALLNPSTVF
jgi:multiple sugar transport system substrate-binding protein